MKPRGAPATNIYYGQYKQHSSSREGSQSSGLGSILHNFITEDSQQMTEESMIVNAEKFNENSQQFIGPNDPIIRVARIDVCEWEANDASDSKSNGFPNLTLSTS